MCPCLPMKVAPCHSGSYAGSDCTEHLCLRTMATQTTAHLDGGSDTCWDQDQQACLLIQQEQEDDHSTEAAPEHWGQRGRVAEGGHHPTHSHTYTCTDHKHRPPTQLKHTITCTAPLPHTHPTHIYLYLYSSTYICTYIHTPVYTKPHCTPPLD